MQLEGKRIIVTGGGSGIAAGTVKGYVKEGANVVFCDVNDEGGAKVEAEANALGAGKATYIHCDISKQENVKEFFAKAMEILGGLDVLANIAGVERNKPATDFVDDDLAFVMGVNLNGTIWTNQEAYKIFRDNKVEGSIINFASDTALSGMPNGAVYAASKGAVASWTRSIAYEWGIASNVRCNIVNPSIKTPMYEYWLKTADPKVVEMHLAGEKMKVPIDGMMGDVEKDMVPVMIFLASEASRFMTGQIFCVNGGRVMTR
ncbi:MAG: SDR family oxidoreductase [Oscillospiraceae bacterium]|nr:SDR family oxidoreductase [Oscillospiraceae bacterium]MBQ3561785.1 SDR family oxidoreductase [Oscillospiraceae bacterium]MBQ6699370.1 SDR family oxidoreductase [Oscillospiraceae bacterium]MBQ6801538.1 SDR family oxidoreductase [Oscillospiraceae bacterium]